jgi:hypothetical protein
MLQLLKLDLAQDGHVVATSATVRAAAMLGAE